MATILIRQAGPYTITFEPGAKLYCNDRPVTMSFLPTPRGEFVGVAETGCKGANGKMDVVGLKAEHVALMREASAAREAELVRKYREQHANQIAKLNELQRKADAHDRISNEGGEGYNPYREQIEAELRDTDAGEAR